MQAIMKNSQGLGLLLDLNWDRLFYVATLIAALAAGAWVASL